MITTNGEVVFSGGVALESGVTGNGEGVVECGGAVDVEGSGDGLIAANTEITGKRGFPGNAEPVVQCGCTGDCERTCDGLVATNGEVVLHNSFAFEDGIAFNGDVVVQNRFAINVQGAADGLISAGVEILFDRY